MNEADKLRKQYKQREDAESGTPVIFTGQELIRTTGEIIYGWYVDGHPVKGWEGERIKLPKKI